MRWSGCGALAVLQWLLLENLATQSPGDPWIRRGSAAELRSPQGTGSPQMWEAFQQVAHRLDSGHPGAQVVVIDRPTAP